MQQNQQTLGQDRTVTPKLNDSFTPLIGSQVKNSDKMLTENELLEIEATLTIDQSRNGPKLETLTVNSAKVQLMKSDRDVQIDFTKEKGGKQLQILSPSLSKQNDLLIAQLGLDIQSQDQEVQKFLAKSTFTKEVEEVCVDQFNLKLPTIEQCIQQILLDVQNIEKFSSQRDQKYEMLQKLSQLNYQRENKLDGWAEYLLLKLALIYFHDNYQKKLENQLKLKTKRWHPKPQYSQELLQKHYNQQKDNLKQKFSPQIQVNPEKIVKNQFQELQDNFNFSYDNYSFLDSEDHFDSLQSTVTPLDGNSEQIWTTGLPDYAGFYLRVTRVSLHIYQSGSKLVKNQLQKKLKTTDCDLTDVTEFMIFQKTSKHKEFQLFTVTEEAQDQVQKDNQVSDFQNDDKLEPMVNVQEIKEQILDTEQEDFHLFELLDGDRVVRRWVLYNYKLIRQPKISIDMVNKKKVFFFAEKQEDQYDLFVLEQSFLMMEQENKNSANQLESIVTPLRIDHINYKKSYWDNIQMFGELIVWVDQATTLLDNDVQEFDVVGKIYYQNINLPEQFYCDVVQTGKQYNYYDSVINLELQQLQNQNFKDTLPVGDTYDLGDLYEIDQHDQFKKRFNQLNKEPCKQNFQSYQYKDTTISTDFLYTECNISVKDRNDTYIFKAGGGIQGCLWVGNQFWVSGGIFNAKGGRWKENNDYFIVLINFTQLVEDGFEFEDELKKYYQTTTAPVITCLPHKKFYFKLPEDKSEVANDRCVIKRQQYQYLLGMKQDVLTFQLSIERHDIIIIKASANQAEVSLCSYKRTQDPVVQYPLQIEKVPWSKTAIRICNLDINQEQLQLDFQDYYVCYVQEGVLDRPFDVKVELQQIDAPYKMRTAVISLEYAVKQRTYGEKAQSLIDVLNNKFVEGPRRKIKSIQFQESQPSDLDYNQKTINDEELLDQEEVHGNLPWQMQHFQSVDLKINDEGKVQYETDYVEVITGQPKFKNAKVSKINSIRSLGKFQIIFEQDGKNYSIVENAYEQRRVAYETFYQRNHHFSGEEQLEDYREQKESDIQSTQNDLNQRQLVNIPRGKDSSSKFIQGKYLLCNYLDFYVYDSVSSMLVHYIDLKDVSEWQAFDQGYFTNYLQQKQLYTLVTAGQMSGFKVDGDESTDEKIWSVKADSNSKLLYFSSFICAIKFNYVDTTQVKFTFKVKAQGIIQCEITLKLQKHILTPDEIEYIKREKEEEKDLHIKRLEKQIDPNCFNTENFIVIDCQDKIYSSKIPESIIQNCIQNQISDTELIIQTNQLFQIDMKTFPSIYFSVWKVSKYRSQLFYSNNFDEDERLQVLATRFRTMSPQVDTICLEFCYDEDVVIWDLQKQQELQRVSRDQVDVKSDEDCLMYFHEARGLWKKFYSSLDLNELRNQQEVTLENLKKVLFLNIRDQTFFSLTEQKKFNSYVETVVSFLEKSQEEILEDDPNFFNRLYNILLVKYNHTSIFNLYFDSQKDYYKTKYKNNKEKKNIFERSILDNDKTKFRQMLRLAMLSSQFKHSDVLSNVQNLNSMLNMSGNIVSLVLEKGYLNNSAASKMETLLAYEFNEMITFTSDNSLLNQAAIAQNFDKEIDEQNEFLRLLNYFVKMNDRVRQIAQNLSFQANIVLSRLRGKQFQLQVKRVQSFKVKVIDISWLEHGTIRFLAETASEQKNFDHEMVKILVEQFDYSQSIFIFVFLPFTLYFAILVYYFCFCLTQAEESVDKGFFQGQSDAIGLRVVVVVMTFYFLFIEIIQIRAEFKQKFNQQLDNIMHIIMLMINVWIILEHSTGFTNIDPIRLSQIASIEMLQLWYTFFKWFRIFDSTAVFVLLIEQVVWNTRYFMVMLIIIFCTFGCATMVLDRQMIQSTDDEYETYASLTDKNFNSYSINYIFGQYLLGLGQADTSNYNQNPSRQLLWIFYVIETFLTQITFFNMLISVMGTTYEEVISLRDRNKLIMRTSVYSEYAGFLNLIEKDKPLKFSKRYLYIAQKQQDQAQEDNQISQINETTKLIQEEQKKNTETMQTLETEISNLKEKLLGYEEQIGGGEVEWIDGSIQKIETEMKTIDEKLVKIEEKMDEKLVKFEENMNAKFGKFEENIQDIAKMKDIMQESVQMKNTTNTRQNVQDNEKFARLDDRIQEKFVKIEQDIQIKFESIESNVKSMMDLLKEIASNRQPDPQIPQTFDHLSE